MSKNLEYNFFNDFDLTNSKNKIEFGIYCSSRPKNIEFKSIIVIEHQIIENTSVEIVTISCTSWTMAHLKTLFMKFCFLV